MTPNGLPAAISASAKAGPTDPRLARLQKKLTDFAFASYRLVAEKNVTLRLHSEEVLRLPGRRTLEIAPRQFERNGRLRVHLHLNSEQNEKLIDADYAVEPGGDLLVGRGRGDRQVPGAARGLGDDGGQRAVHGAALVGLGRVVDGRAHHGPHAGVHARRVAAAGEYSNSFHMNN